MISFATGVAFAETEAEDSGSLYGVWIRDSMQTYTSMNDKIVQDGCFQNSDITVKLYEYVNGQYIRINDSSLVSNNTDIASVKYYETGTYGSNYYIIEFLKSDSVTFSYTYTVNSEEKSGSFSISIRKPQMCSMNKRLVDFYDSESVCLFETLEDGAKCTDFGLGFYTSEDIDSLIKDKSKLIFPENAGTFTEVEDSPGYFDWCYGDAEPGLYQVKYNDGEKEYYANLYVYASEEALNNGLKNRFLALLNSG